MPLERNALELIRANLEALQRGEKVPAVTIGRLTEVQLTAINGSRAAAASVQPPINGEIYFIGRHIYERRMVKDGYTIEDVLDQITSALPEVACFIQTRGQQ